MGVQGILFVLIIAFSSADKAPRTSSLIVIAVLIVFFSLALASVFFVPVYITKLKAASLGLSLTYRQARLITKDYCNRKDFYVSVREIWTCEQVPIERLTRHYNAKGNMRNLKDAIVAMSQKAGRVNFEMLAALDLAGRDLKKELEKAEANNWEFKWFDKQH